MNKTIAQTILTFLIVVATFACNSVLAQPLQRATVPPDFKGKSLLALSDADMVASAYIDGKLGPIVGPDELTIIPFTANQTVTTISKLPVTNSVTGPPASIAVSPDGKYAIVIETQGVRPANKPDALKKELAPGHAISVIDVTNPAQPHIVQRLQGGERPVSVCFNATGDRVAVAYSLPKSKQAPLVLYKFVGGQLVSPAMPTILGWQQDDDLIDVCFYGKENTLALVNIGNPALTFYQIKDSASSIQLIPWGNSVMLDNSPFLVRFTTDGRYALCNSMAVDSPAQRSSIVCIRIAASQAADGSPVHRLISHAIAGCMPEGIAVSPDGKWVATANLERSYEPQQTPQQGFYASISLLSLDAAGQLSRVGDFPFSGILPETVVFDNSSRYIAITTFDHYADLPAGGSVDFWCIRPDPYKSQRVELVKTGYTVPVKRGVHLMVLVR